MKIRLDVDEDDIGSTLAALFGHGWLRITVEPDDPPAELGMVEDAVLEHLRESGPATAGIVAAATGLDETLVRSALAALEHHGLIVHTGGHGYRAVPQ